MRPEGRGRPETCGGGGTYVVFRRHTTIGLQEKPHDPLLTPLDRVMQSVQPNLRRKKPTCLHVGASKGEFIYLVWHVDGRSGGEKYLDDFIVTVMRRQMYRSPAILSPHRKRIEQSKSSNTSHTHLSLHVEIALGRLSQDANDVRVAVDRRSVNAIRVDLFEKVGA